MMISIRPKSQRKLVMIGKFDIKVLGLAMAMLLTACPVTAENDEDKVGKAAAAQILGAAPLLDIKLVNQYLNLVGNSVASISGAGYRWRFAAIKSDAVNAFAAPGGYVLVSVGLLKILESEDELAFVLAHEAVHVHRKHHYNVVKRQRLVDQAAQSLQSMDKENDLSVLSNLSGQMYARGLDKGAEYEADRLGVEAMTQAGYDPAAALSVLEKLMALQGSDPRAELLFSTHPSPASRIDQLIAAGVDKLPRPKQRLAPVEQRFKNFRAQL
jgi:predicted Zn-dependent protease